VRFFPFTKSGSQRVQYSVVWQYVISCQRGRFILRRQEVLDQYGPKTQIQIFYFIIIYFFQTFIYLLIVVDAIAEHPCLTGDLLISVEGIWYCVAVNGTVPSGQIRSA
jgi:hypothetical protein